jgi:biotin carboxyl carrier protein
MRRFRVIVNGLAYEVEVEELATDGAALSHAPATAPSPAPQAAAPAPAPAAAPASVPAAAPPAADTHKAKPPKKADPHAAAGEGAVTSPLPGTVLDVKVNVGDQVAEGQVVAILEAMKMENEILAPKAGSVTAVHVKAGTAVGLGDTIIEIG